MRFPIGIHFNSIARLSHRRPSLVFGLVGVALPLCYILIINYACPVLPGYAGYECAMRFFIFGPVYLAGLILAALKPFLLLDGLFIEKHVQALSLLVWFLIGAIVPQLTLGVRRLLRP